MKRLYYKYLYRHIMRLAHRFNWHYMEPNPWLESGKIHYWCHWCGLRSQKNINTPKPMSKITVDDLIELEQKHTKHEDFSKAVQERLENHDKQNFYYCW